MFLTISIILNIVLVTWWLSHRRGVAVDLIAARSLFEQQRNVLERQLRIEIGELGAERKYLQRTIESTNLSLNEAKAAAGLLKADLDQTKIKLDKAEDSLLEVLSTLGRKNDR